MITNSTAFLFLRLVIAMSMFGHGLVRLPKLTAFSEGMIGKFQSSMLPAVMVKPFSYILPFTEFTIGLLLLFGFLTKPSLIAGSVVMILLVFGSCMIEDWSAIPSQLFHALFFAILLSHLQYNTFALDHIIFK